MNGASFTWCPVFHWRDMIRVRGLGFAFVGNFLQNANVVEFCNFSDLFLEHAMKTDIIEEKVEFYQHTIRLGDKIPF